MTSTARGTIAPIRRPGRRLGESRAGLHRVDQELAVWWPFERHSVFGADSGAAFVDWIVVETGPDGSQQLWGTVMTWEPGHQLTMTWHPGQNEDAATTVDVRFDAISDEQTLVTLTHTGWGTGVDAAEARDEYGKGWPTVVGQFTAAQLDAVSGSEVSSGPGASGSSCSTPRWPAPATGRSSASPAVP